jgi:hypothetical protein
VTFVLYSALTSSADSARGSLHSSTQAPVVPIDYSWAIGTDPALGEYLFFEGTLRESVEQVSFTASNWDGTVKRIVAKDLAIAKGHKVNVNPSHGWIWKPGNSLTVNANGYAPLTVRLPFEDTAAWMETIRSACVYTVTQRGAADRLDCGANLHLEGDGYKALLQSLELEQRKELEQQRKEEEEDARLSFQASQLGVYYQNPFSEALREERFKRHAKEEQRQRFIENMMRDRAREYTSEPRREGTPSTADAPRRPIPLDPSDPNLQQLNRIFDGFSKPIPNPRPLSNTDISLPVHNPCPTCHGTKVFGKTSVPGYGVPGAVTQVDAPCPQCGGTGYVNY